MVAWRATPERVGRRDDGQESGEWGRQGEDRSELGQRAGAQSSEVELVGDVDIPQKRPRTGKGKKGGRHVEYPVSWVCRWVVVELPAVVNSGSSGGGGAAAVGGVP